MPSVWSPWRWVTTTSSISPTIAAIRSACARSSGPGSTTTQVGDPGARRTTVLVPSNVISEGLSQRMTPDSSVTGRSVSYAGKLMGASPADI